MSCFSKLAKTMPEITSKIPAKPMMVIFSLRKITLTSKVISGIMYIYIFPKLVDMESKLVVTKGERGGEVN